MNKNKRLAESDTSSLRKRSKGIKNFVTQQENADDVNKNTRESDENVESSSDSDDISDSEEEEKNEIAESSGDNDDESELEALVRRTSPVEIISEHMRTEITNEKRKRELEKLKNFCEDKVWLDGRYFEVQYEKSVDRGNNGIIATCKVCNNEYSGRLNVSSNFIKHLQRSHPEDYEDYKNYKARKADCRRKTIKRTTCKFSQKKFNKNVTNFFATGCASLRQVEDPKFIKIFTSMKIRERGKPLKVISRRELSRRIKNRFHNIMNKIKEQIQHIEHFCTTADIWTSGARRAMGVTLHWIDPDTLERKSMAIACKRFDGTHSYNRISGIIDSIHAEFNLNAENIIATVTDNASNFRKAFEKFGVVLEEQVYDDAGISLNDESREVQEIIPHDDDDNEREPESWRSKSFDEELQLAPHLPLHLRCAIHTLSLVATTDATRAIDEDEELSEPHYKAMKDFTKIWKLMRSSKNRKMLTKILGHTLRRPISVRWNTLYKAMGHLLSIQDKIDEAVREMEIPDPPDSSDFEYITMFTTCMEPIASAISRLEGDKNVYYGELLPTLVTIERKLQKLSESPDFVTFFPLLEALRSSLQNRFENVFKVENTGEIAAIAAFSYPKFKFMWLAYFTHEKQGEIRDMIKRKARNLMKNVDDTREFITRQLSDFYDFGVAPEAQTSHADNSNFDLDVEIIKYLNDPRNTLEMIDSYPIIEKLFLIYTTPLPSSAPVERLFSFATLMDWAEFNCLTDNFFEIRVLGIANANNIKN